MQGKLGKSQLLGKDEVRRAYAKWLEEEPSCIPLVMLSLVSAPDEIVKDRARFTKNVKNIADALRELFTGKDIGVAATAVLSLSQGECRLTSDDTRTGRKEFGVDALGPYKVFTPKNGTGREWSRVSFEELCYHMHTPELAYVRVCQWLNETAARILAGRVGGL